MDKANVAIALPDDTEGAREVISRGRRIARYLGLEWIAVRVISGSRDANDSEVRSEICEWVSALGGRLVLARAHDIARTIVDLCEREHARLLVIGRSRRPRLLRRLKRGTTEQILRARRPFDVVIAAEGVDQ